MKKAADPFAKQAAGYAAFRPTYPPRVLEILASACAGSVPTATAMDIGCGSGQVRPFGPLAHRDERAQLPCVLITAAFIKKSSRLTWRNKGSNR